MPLDRFAAEMQGAQRQSSVQLCELSVFALRIPSCPPLQKGGENAPLLQRGGWGDFIALAVPQAMNDCGGIKYLKHDVGRKEVENRSEYARMER